MKTNQEKLALKKKRLWSRQILNFTISMIVMLIIFKGLAPGISYLKGPKNLQSILAKIDMLEDVTLEKEQYVQLEADNLYGPYYNTEKTITSEGKNGVKSSFDVRNQYYLYVLPDEEHAISIQAQGEKDITIINEYIRQLEENSVAKPNTLLVKGGLWQLNFSERKEAIAYFEELMDTSNLDDASIYQYGITMNRLGGQTAYMNLIYVVIFVIAFIYMIIGWIVFCSKLINLNKYEGESNL